MACIKGAIGDIFYNNDVSNDNVKYCDSVKEVACSDELLKNYHLYLQLPSAL